MAKSQLTRRAIMAAFVKLINLRPLDKITVKDIVEECGINRNTFYYHYHDLGELLLDVFESDLRHFMETPRDSASLAESCRSAAAFFLENRRAVYHVYNSDYRELLQRYLNTLLGEVTIRFVRQQAEGIDVAEEDILFISSFYQNAMTGILLSWLKGHMKTDVDAYLNALERCFDGSIRAALLRAAQNRRSPENSDKS